jgi:hypothetical protein
MSQMQDWMQWQPTTEKNRLGFLVLTPARIVVGVGALVTMIAGLMPWAEGTVPGRAGFEPITFSGLGGAGDGVMLILFAGGIAFLVLHRTPASSRVRLVHVIPYVLLVLAAASLVTAYRAASQALIAWENRGGQGSISLGLYLAAVGIVVMGIGLAALLPGLIRWRRASDDPADLMAVSKRGIVESVAGMAGILVGGALGIQLAVSMTPVPLIGLISLGAVFGGLLGAYAGSWIARSVADEASRRRSNRH